LAQQHCRVFHNFFEINSERTNNTQMFQSFIEHYCTRLLLVVSMAVRWHHLLATNSICDQLDQFREAHCRGQHSVAVIYGQVGSLIHRHSFFKCRHVMWKRKYEDENRACAIRTSDA